MLIAGVGLIGSGKDTFAERLVSQYGYKQMVFAESLKDATAAVFGWDRKKLDGKTTEDRVWREQVDQWWSNRLNIPHLTPRWVLQQLGTEVFRQNFHDDIWIASLEHKLLYNKEDIVISDCRFPNEVAAVKKAKGLVVRIIRGEEPQWFPIAIEACLGNTAAQQYLKDNEIHASEWSWANTEFDYVLVNNGTLDEFYHKIDEFIHNQE